MWNYLTGTVTKGLCPNKTIAVSFSEITGQTIKISFCSTETKKGTNACIHVL